METPVLLHLYGTEPGEAGRASRRVARAASLTDELCAQLESSLHYGSPERPGVGPPIAWSVLPLGEEHTALTRSWRPPPGPAGPSPMVAISAVFPSADDLLGSAAVLDLAEDTSLFPEAPEALPSGPLERSVVATGARVTDAFDRLLQTVRGDRKALVALIAACATSADPNAALRAVVLSLPEPGFRDPSAILRTMVGLAAALPRRLRLRLSFATYQDAVAPRPMPLLAIPDNHRCMPRLVRSSGYVVFPGPPPQESFLSTHALSFAELAAEHLLAGRFEEARALTAAARTDAGATDTEAQDEIRRHAELLRIAERPACDPIIDWLTKHGVPTDEERRNLLFTGIAAAIDDRARAGDPGPAAQLLRVLGLRWPEPDWDRALIQRLRPALVAMLAVWHQKAGWEAVEAFFGRVSSAGIWLRGALWEAAAEALAADAAGDPAENLAFAERLEERLEALENVHPPGRYLRWRASQPALVEALRELHLERLLALPNAQEVLLDLLAAFDTPEDPRFTALMAPSLGAVLTRRPEFAVDLVVDLSSHYRERLGGLEVVDVALGVLEAREAEDCAVELTRATLLRATQGNSRHRRRHGRLLARAAAIAPLSRWRDEVSHAIAAGSADRALVLTNLRKLWTVTLEGPRPPGSDIVVAELVRLAQAEPELCRDPSPHDLLLQRAGPPASAALAVEELLLLTRQGEDDESERYLAVLFAVYSRRLAGDPMSWQRALLEAASSPSLGEDARARALWWLWSAGRRQGFLAFARHAGQRLLSSQLLAALDTGRFELLCRLLPSDTSFDRERIVRAAVEASLTRWRHERSPATAVDPEVFRLFSPQADRLSESAYVGLVRRYAEECLLDREPHPDDLRTLLDRVFVPRHWEALAELFRELGARRPALRGQLAGLRKTTLGRRLPPQLLGYFATSPGPTRPPTTTLE